MAFLSSMHLDYLAIRQRFGYRLQGNLHMQYLVCQTLSRMPLRIIARITSHCWFLSSSEDAWAYTFRGDDLSHQHMIFLTDELLAQPDRFIQYTIAHEIGHVILNHHNAINRKQTRQEVSHQEQAADAFAKHYCP